MSIAKKDLDFWIENNYNVMLEGEAGIGKTSIILSAFNRHELKWKYFSGSTLDPWVDFVGVPKENEDENGNKFLDLVRPKDFANDEIEAIFIDEYNRSHKKVKNAVMELIQFKSINGKKFNNLRMVWSAINPEDSQFNDNYDVEPLDPAQKDRFHIYIKLPYKPDVSYFKSKYGDAWGRSAVEWWNGLDKETKHQISPRRLDYALDIAKKGGGLKYVFTSGKKANHKKLVEMLLAGEYRQRIEELVKTKKEDDIAWFNDPNNFSVIGSVLEKNTGLAKSSLKYFSPENLINYVETTKNKLSFVEGIIVPSVIKNEELKQALVTYSEGLKKGSLKKTLSKSLSLKHGAPSSLVNSSINVGTDTGSVVLQFKERLSGDDMLTFLDLIEEKVRLNNFTSLDTKYFKYLKITDTLGFGDYSNTHYNRKYMSITLQNILAISVGTPTKVEDDILDEIDILHNIIINRKIDVDKNTTFNVSKMQKSTFENFLIKSTGRPIYLEKGMTKSSFLKILDHETVGLLLAIRYCILNSEEKHFKKLTEILRYTKNDDFVITVE